MMTKSICFVCPGAYTYFDETLGLTSGGGAERQIHLLSTQLADRFDVHVVVADYGQLETERRDGVTLHRAYPLHPRENPFQPLKHLLLLGRAMYRADADIYIYRGSPRNAGIVYLLTRLLGSKWLYHIASDANIVERPACLPWGRYWLFQRGVRNADSIVTQTDFQRDFLKETYGTQSTVVPNGYPKASDVPSFEERDLILWVGRLNEDEKRPQLFLDLAEKVPKTQFRFVGPLHTDSETHEKIYERAQSIDNLKLIGEVQPHEIHEEYRNAFALVNTSAYEGFPNTFLEAWRQGTPVLSLDVDPKRYLSFEVADGYAQGDLEQLIRYCKQLTEDPDTWRLWAEESKNLFESKLSINQVTKQYATVLRSI